MGRSPCCDKNGLKKGPWTPEEDQKLIDYIQTHGSGNWRTLPKNAGLQRCGKSCRLRWTNYLRPDIKRGKFTLQEEETIIHLHSILGNKWSAIACRLPGRTDNEIKNYWNTHIRKRLLRMGIDPVTHNPRLDLLDISSLLNQSFYNHQFTNPNSRMARFLGLQPMVDPEILKFATSIFSRPTEPDPNSNFTVQIQGQNPTLIDPEIQQHQEQLVGSNCMQFCDQAQALASMNESLIHDYDSLTNVGFENQMPGFCASSGNLEGHLPNLLDSDVINQHNYVTWDNNDQSLIGSKFFVGPSSSSTPLHSNSNSNSTYIANEDERESYCSNLMKFEFPADFLDVSEYL
ncbi:hypothetical protein V2J09_010076 [Rumex salicifolius]